MYNDEESNNMIQELEKFFQESLNNSPPKEEEKKKIYLCIYEILDIPRFNFYLDGNINKLKLSCLCKREDELSFEQAFLQLTFDYDKHRNYDDYFFCQIPGHENNEFKYYCEKCQKNLCCLCIEKFKVCPHNDNYLFNFNQNYNNFIDIGESIKNQLNIINIDPFIPRLFDVIYDNFKEYKNNYSYFYIIKKYNEFIANKNFN